MKKVWKITLQSADCGYSHTSFYHGKAWEAVQYGVTLAEKKNKEGDKEWILFDVTRIK